MVHQVFNDPLGNTFSLSLVDKNPHTHSLYPRIEFNLLLSHKQGGPFFVLNPNGHIRIEAEGRMLYIGDLSFDHSIANLSAGQDYSTVAYLDLDPYRLLQIEKIRANKSLKLTMNIQFSIMKYEKTRIRYDSTTKGTIHFEIAQSQWVEKFLPAFKFKEVSIIEIPKLDAPDYAKVIEYMDSAWHNNSIGQYDIVLVNCRKAIEELGEIVKKSGFEKTTTLKSGEDATIPDWRAFLNQKDMGKNVDEITENIRKFCSPAAHRGKSINKEDADYALMITHATANILIKRVEKIEQIT